jgi:hypothetical protein
VLAFGFKALIFASNLLLGLSAGTVVLQLVLQRLVIVASNRCDGVVVVALEALEDELLPPPQDARRMVEEARRIKVISRFKLISLSQCESALRSVESDTSATKGRG